MASSWFLYIIEYGNGSLYTGITTDVERRFAEHCGGGAKAAKALRGKGPFSLVFSQQMASRSEALSIESQIKKLSKSRKLAIVAQGHFDVT